MRDWNVARVTPAGPLGRHAAMLPAAGAADLAIPRVRCSPDPVTALTSETSVQPARLLQSRQPARAACEEASGSNWAASCGKARMGVAPKTPTL